MFVFHVSVFHLCVLFGKISIHILVYFCFLRFVFSLFFDKKESKETSKRSVRFHSFSSNVSDFFPAWNRNS